MRAIHLIHHGHIMPDAPAGSGTSGRLRRCHRPVFRTDACGAGTAQVLSHRSHTMTGRRQAMTEAATMSKSERVYQHLREEILTGAYADGYRIVLDKVARELNVSPVPARAAVRRLAADGLGVRSEEP